jgi:nucleoside-specific outer membrane channel protein Tsx
MFWVSLDANYQFGGETTTDGIPGDDDKESFGLGATIGVNLSKQLSVNATYGEVISHNDNGADGHMFRVKLAYLF